MTDLYKNKYKINSTRLKDWDYSSSAWYCVTICTKDRLEYFGKIENGQMYLSEIGKIVKNCWQKIPKHFSNTDLDFFVIMPNHIHGIVIINNEDNSKTKINPPVETCHGMSLRSQLKNFNRNENVRKFGKPVKNSLSIIINHFKGSLTRECNLKNLPFKWQPSFYDSIIKSQKQLEDIRHYIYINPIKWDIDRNNPKNI